LQVYNIYHHQVLNAKTLGLNMS